MRHQKLFTLFTVFKIGKLNGKFPPWNKLNKWWFMQEKKWEKKNCSEMLYTNKQDMSEHSNANSDPLTRSHFKWLTPIPQCCNFKDLIHWEVTGLK